MYLCILHLTLPVQPMRIGTGKSALLDLKHQQSASVRREVPKVQTDECLLNIQRQ